MSNITALLAETRITHVFGTIQCLQTARKLPAKCPQNARKIENLPATVAASICTCPLVPA
jgi:hypothetical protein